MRKIKEYGTMNAASAEGLDKIVNRHLSAGWELYGSPGVAKGGNYGDEIFTQAMVLYASPKKKRKK